MIRLICFENDYGEPANVGGLAKITHRTFDVELPEFERWLSEEKPGGATFVSRGFIEIEIANKIVNKERST